MSIHRASLKPILTTRQKQRKDKLYEHYAGNILNHIKTLRTLNHPMSFGEAIDRFYEIERAHGTFRKKKGE